MTVWDGRMTRCRTQDAPLPARDRGIAVLLVVLVAVPTFGLGVLGLWVMSIINSWQAPQLTPFERAIDA